ncbi:TonB-dependent receptor [Sulfurimonas sp.]
MKTRVYLSIICAVTLNLAAADLGEIQVESSTIEDLNYDKKTEVSTINTIDAQTIEELNPKNINEILQSVPGITADVRNSAVEIHIRGIAQQEFMWEDTGVAIVIDGVPVLQNGGKVKFNIDEIESIKVIKGGASYLYGNTALAGAVIITTKKNKNKNSADLKLEVGDYGYKNAEINAYKSTENYAANLNMNYTDDDSYWGIEGRNWTKSANAKVQYYSSDTSDVTFGLNYTDKFEAGGGSVTGVTNASEYPQGIPGDWSYIRDYYSTLQKYFITFNNDFIDGSNLKINTYYYKDIYDYQSSPTDTTGDLLDDSYRNDNSDEINQYGIKMEYKGSLDALAYMVGIDLGERVLKDYTLQLVDVFHRGYAGDSALGDTTEDNYAIYAETKYQVNSRLTFVLNGRYDYNNYSYNVNSHDYNGTIWSDSSVSNNDSFDNISYRFGATYSFNKSKILFSNVSTGYRNPTIKQMYAGDYDSDYLNNPDLKEETTLTFELGLRGNINIFYYEASLFLTKTKDIIGKNGGTYYSDNTNLMYDNVGDARNQGFELTFKSDRREIISFNMAYTYLDAYYTKHNPFIVSLGNPYIANSAADDATYDINGNQLPRVPHHKLNFITYYKAMKNLELMAEVYAQSDYYADETNLVKMPGYATLNLKASYQHKKDMEFFFQVTNLFDKQYYRTVYLFSDRNYDGVLDAEDASITVDPGRVMYAGLKYKF